MDGGGGPKPPTRIPTVHTKTTTGVAPEPTPEPEPTSGPETTKAPGSGGSPPPDDGGTPPEGAAGLKKRENILAFRCPLKTIILDIEQKTKKYPWFSGSKKLTRLNKEGQSLSLP